MVDKAKVQEIFSSIAARYDFLNHLLSLNIDRRWRKLLVDCSMMQSGSKILDVCTGTGDIAIEFAHRGCSGIICGMDSSDGMLRIAREKIATLKLQDTIVLGQGDCLRLPFDDKTIDIVTIGFGLRNLSSYKKGIAEMVRVLNDGGRLLILEFSMPGNVLLSRIYRFYLNSCIPLIGGMISGSKRAYSYLASSIAAFPARKEILRVMKAYKLETVYCKELSGGIAALYCGRRGATA
jgi:demethylmenaquinone methyltransferase/2-methoxy-6-polyprenyl-1,4-benzoquinol methylase